LELGVDLLELGLLRLEAALRLAQRAALLLELLVADPQLLLLRLQRLALLLGLLEQLLEARAVAGRPHGDAERVGRAGQQLLLDGADAAEEPRLQPRLHRRRGA